MQNFRFHIFLVLIASWGLGIGPCDAREAIKFGPETTKIIGSIPYSVIGQYQAQFRSFQGRIILDEGPRRVRSVYLEIDAKSIVSNCPWCDRIARSRRLLNTVRYPKIIFRSSRIIQDKGGFKVNGTLEMHGIRRQMTFPFDVKTGIDPKTGQKYLEIKGDWKIGRKAFNITWNKYLDRGGFLVGDQFSVHWRIRA